MSPFPGRGSLLFLSWGSKDKDVSILSLAQSYLRRARCVCVAKLSHGCSRLVRSAWHEPFMQRGKHFAPTLVSSNCAWAQLLLPGGYSLTSNLTPSTPSIRKNRLLGYSCRSLSTETVNSRSSNTLRISKNTDSNLRGC